MLKISSSFVVEISGAKFHFKKPTFKSIQLLSEKQKEGKDMIDDIFANLVKVEGLQDEDGNDLDAAKVKTLELPFDVINMIMNAWTKEIQALGIGGKTDPNAEKQPIS